MFGRKKRRAMLAVLTEFGDALYEGPQDAYPLPEAEVLRLSEMYFSDPEPCAIHRGAVRQRVFMELGERYAGAGGVALAELTAEDRRYFPGAFHIRLWEEEA